MKKRILASLLGLSMIATPIVAFAQTITVPTDAVIAGVANVAQFVEVHNGRTYFGLRRVAEAYGADVGWNQANQTITLTFNGAELAARFSADAGVDVTDVVRPGTFSVELRNVDGALYVANGPAAGTRLVSSLINDRHYIFAGAFTANLPNDAAVLYGQANLATNLIQTALTVLTGRSVTYNVTAGGISITLGDEVTLPAGAFLPPTAAVTLPAEIEPPTTAVTIPAEIEPPTTAVTIPAEVPPPGVAVQPIIPEGRFTPGTFTGTSTNTYSHNPNNEGGLSPTPLVVEIVVDADRILEARVASHGETGVWVNVMAAGAINYVVEQQRAAVDTIAGATYTSRAINEAAAEAIAAAEAR